MASIYSSIYGDEVPDVLHQADNDGFNTSSDELDRRPSATGASAAMLVGGNKIQAFQLCEFAAKGKHVKVKAMSKLSDAVKEAAPKDTAKSKKKAAADKVAIAGLTVAWCFVIGLILFNSLHRNQQAGVDPSSAGDGAEGGDGGISSSDFPPSTKLRLQLRRASGANSTALLLLSLTTAAAPPPSPKSAPSTSSARRRSWPRRTSTSELALVLAAGAELFRTARHVSEIHIAIALREDRQIFPWRKCATRWVPHPVQWGLQLERVLQAELCVVLSASLIRKISVVILIPILEASAGMQLHLPFFFLFIFFYDFPFYYVLVVQSPACTAIGLLSDRDIESLCLLLSGHVVLYLQPLILKFSAPVRQLLLRRLNGSSASIQVFGLSFICLRQHHQHHLSVVGLVLLRRLYRTSFHRRVARSVHLGARVSGAPAYTPRRQNCPLSRPSRRYCLIFRSQDLDVCMSSSEDLYVIWLL